MLFACICTTGKLQNKLRHTIVENEFSGLNVEVTAKLHLLLPGEAKKKGLPSVQEISQKNFHVVFSKLRESSLFTFSDIHLNHPAPASIQGSSQELSSCHQCSHYL